MFKISDSALPSAGAVMISWITVYTHAGIDDVRNLPLSLTTAPEGGNGGQDWYNLIGEQRIGKYISTFITT